MRLAVMLVLAAVPFVAIALLIWRGPRSAAARGLSDAVKRHDDTAHVVETERHRLEQADQRLTSAQRRLEDDEAGL